MPDPTLDGRSHPSPQTHEELLRFRVAMDMSGDAIYLVDRMTMRFVDVNQTACARMGFDVETASNGIQALVKAGRFKPDILVIDVNMPEVDGLSVCAHLLGPDRTPVNVIVITGSRDPDTLERCEGFGAYYARKGPNFWNDLEVALAEIHPRMAGRIRQCGTQAPTPAVRKRTRVLLVDDDGDINQFLASRLEKCGLDVQYASDAQQGYRMACRDEPAVIVTGNSEPFDPADSTRTR